MIPPSLRGRAIAAALALSAAGLVTIAHHEGYTERATIPVPGDVPTLGYGTTRNPDGTPVRLGQTTTPPRALAALLADTSAAQQAVANCTTQPITQDQFDALVSLAYNIGGGAYCGSTLVRRLNAGDCHAAAAEFERWIRVQGRVVPGLVARRAAERKRFQAHCGAAT